MTYFNRFDIVEAYYAFFSDYHEGQASEKYSRLCKISTYFTPGPLWSGLGSLTENGVEIYHQLVEKHQVNV